MKSLSFGSKFLRLLPLSNKTRHSRGVALGLVAAVALIIVMLVVASFRLYVYLMGSQELKNSVDASVLNIARHVWEVEVIVPWQDSNSQWVNYIDVWDTRHMIGLANINRLWGKAYLVAANAQDMKSGGYDPSGCGKDSADCAYAWAQMLNQQLFSKLNNRLSVSSYFKEMAKNKPAKILGENGQVAATVQKDWAIADGYRLDESNLEVSDSKTIPDIVKPNLVNAGASEYMQGYLPMEAAGHSFCFTTFHLNEPSHLVSGRTFDQWHHVPVVNESIPIPNTFRDSGQLTGNLSLGAAACAVANPMVSYELAIPHSFLTITLDPSVVTAIAEGVGQASATYGPGTGAVAVIENYQYKAHPGTLLGYVNLGNEFNPPTVWQAINGQPGDHTKAIDYMVRRIKQMKPGFTAAQLQALLSQAFIPKAKFDNVPTYTWCIYPTYQTPDLSDPQVQVAMDPPPGFFPGLLNRPPECAGVPQGLGQAPPPPVTDWIHSLYTRPPEGIEKTVAVEPTQINRPNWSWSVVMGWQYAQDHSWAENNGTLYWRPGTGLFNWLGNLRIHRTTTAYFTGQPPQPEPPRTK